MPPISADPQLITELQRVYLFAGLDSTQFQRVLAVGQSYSVETDASLFEQGQPADRFFLVRRGLMKLSRLSPSGDEKVIEFLPSGQTFAEALMFMGKTGPYPVTARAIEPSEVLGFENRGFLAILRESPDTCFRVMGSMSKRLHALVNEIDRLALQSATSRLIDFLLTSEHDGKVELRTPKHVLASRLSIKPETLSRIFARLATDGHISVHGSHIDLHRLAELRKILEAESI
jgi:CRP-like cAMP-binding protein